MERETVRRVDALVASEVFPSRSRAIQEAVADKLSRLSRSRLDEQCELLDITEEQSMADELGPEEEELWQ